MRIRNAGMAAFALLLVAAVAVAARPVKPPPEPTVEVPTIVDSTGAAVGAIVPTMASEYSYQTVWTHPLAALYRTVDANIKVLFWLPPVSPSSAAPEIFFKGTIYFSSTNCTGPPIGVGPYSFGEYAGYALDTVVIPPNSAEPEQKPKVVRFELGPTGMTVYSAYDQGIGDGGGCLSLGRILTAHPVISVTDFPFVGPYAIK